MKQWQIFALVGAVLIVLIVLVLIIYRPGGAPGGDETADGPVGVRELKDGELPEFMDPKVVLAQYMKDSIYPPASRPLKPTMTDLLNPNSRYENFIPTGGPPADLAKQKAGPPPAADYYYRLTADKYALIGDDSIRFTLRAARKPSENVAPVPLKVLSSSLNTGQSHLKYKKVADIRLNDDGVDGDTEKGDRIFTVVIQPSKTNIAQYHGRCQVYVKFEIDGETTEALVPFEYYPASTIPAEFTGEFREEVNEGSLTIHAGIQVLKPGYYLIDANLFDAEEGPVGYTRFKGELKGGFQEVPLQFFGKVIRDADPVTPFVLKNLRGFRLLEDKTPDRQLIPPPDKGYRTRAYNDIEVFSEKAWDSPRKQAKIEFLKKQVEAGVGMPESVN